MRSALIIGTIAVLGAGLLCDPAEAARNRRGVQANGSGTSMSNTYYAYLSEPDGNRRASRRTSNGRRSAANSSAYYSYANVNNSSVDLGPPRGTTTRSAGTFSLRDSSRSAFDGRGRVDGAEFFKRLQERSSAF